MSPATCIHTEANSSRDTIWTLTHWGRVTHICVSKLTIIGSHNGLSPDRRHAIIWTKAGILSSGTNFGEILIEIDVFSFQKMHLKMSSVICRPFCPGRNVLINYPNRCHKGRLPDRILWFVVDIFPFTSQKRDVSVHGHSFWTMDWTSYIIVTISYSICYIFMNSNAIIYQTNYGRKCYFQIIYSVTRIFWQCFCLVVSCAPGNLKTSQKIAVNSLAPVIFKETF